MKGILSKKIRNTAMNFAGAYPDLKIATTAFEKWKGMQRDIDIEKNSEYELRVRHLQTIEATFKQAVTPEKQDRVWKYFYKEISVEPYERAELEVEISKWIYTLAKELGITTDFQNETRGK